MEKKQLFDSSLVGFHPETFIPSFKLDINIDDNNIYADFNITKHITIDDNFIDIYNKIEELELCSIRLNITNNNSDNSNTIFPGYRSAPNLFFRDVVFYKSSEKILISNFDIININISSKTAYVRFIRKIISQSDLDNTIVRLTTRVNELSDLTIGGFNETVTLTDEEYNELNKISIGEIFTLIDNNSDTIYFTVKSGDSSFRSFRNYCKTSKDYTRVISFLFDLAENNQATFEGRIDQLMDPNNYLAKDNTTEYTPTADYNPATKKYVDDKYYRIEQSGRFDLDLIIGGARYDHALKYSLSLNMSGNTYTVILEILNTNNEALAYKIISDDRQDSIVATNQLAYINTTFTYDSSYFANKLTVNLILDSTINIDFKDKTIGLTINSITAKCLSTIVTETEYSKFTDTNDNILYFVTPN